MAAQDPRDQDPEDQGPGDQDPGDWNPGDWNRRSRLAVFPYRRRFTKTLVTAHGPWRWREGAIVRLTDDRGCSTFGELAPVPWFGTETLEVAIAALDPLKTGVDRGEIAAIPDHLPACRFALGMAIAPWPPLSLGEEPQIAPERVAGLLPAGAGAIAQLPQLWERGHRTVKWKIGVDDPTTELAIFEQLLGQLPAGGRLRLDANGALDEAMARRWLAACDRAGDRVEFLEQPLPPGQEMAMGQLAAAFGTAIALDESVATVGQLRRCHDRGWGGPMVIKPAIAGDPLELLALIRDRALDVVLSSVFETAVGLGAILAIADQLPSDRALGIGTAAWLEPLPDGWWQRLREDL
ncbi:MAG: o-succinylbenzoate synthase [Cyanophyceae cyanobacterium]